MNTMTNIRDLTGETFGRFTVLALGGHCGGNRKWLCRCDCGTEKQVRGSHLTTGRIRSCGCLASELTSARNAVELPEYAGAHARIRRTRGSASKHRCVDCGETAREWSYDHEDPDDYIQVGGQGDGCRYSLDPSHYDPRCLPCHRQFDDNPFSTGAVVAMRNHL